MSTFAFIIQPLRGCFFLFRRRCVPRTSYGVICLGPLRGRGRENDIKNILIGMKCKIACVQSGAAIGLNQKSIPKGCNVNNPACSAGQRAHPPKSIPQGWKVNSPVRSAGASGASPAAKSIPKGWNVNNPACSAGLKGRTRPKASRRDAR